MLKLKEIKTDNWLDVIRLSSGEDQKNKIFEQYIASNCLSIAQASVSNEWVTRAIYNDETLIGFTMYGYSEELKGYEVCRLMVDYHFQGQGFGREALQLIIKVMKIQYECKEILICFLPDNFKARTLYETCGFENTGKTIEDEVIYVLKFV
ncbi:GNAT family N-acetyltransferase [Mesobacillus maritimus]|uniref:GNAT family N-acetyltransferase n=1 Tax=Mesobacillus maritimus TaxID=1643336 RepID=A0ABS7K847_9BACI|nr:GNAT family N-acetyltransferase [Mesobacillus maritimus]MBY0098437.1 GNAT family N-acetyltransferase [Mesobacillus maritimus]